MLDNKVMVVTGGAGALGQTVASVAAGYGAQVHSLDIVADFAPKQGVYHCVDLTDAAALQSCIDDIVKNAGQIDAVANIAGGFDMGPQVHETDDQLWDSLVNINVTTLRRMITAITPHMLSQNRGAIVNVGAMGALRGNGNMGAYSAAKSTVMRLTEALSDELKGQGINVNAVLPSLIDTPRNRADMPDADFDTWLKPQDLAEVVCFLCSPRARAVHGALLPVTALS